LQKAEKYPNRFAGFATVAWQAPEEAARELERAVKELGLKGLMLQQAKSDGTFFDEQKYWVIYEMAEKLDVPVYLHPGAMPPDMSKYYDYYPLVGWSMWGFSVSTSLHAVRMIMSGVFDKHPGFKLMLGHMGEGIPYWLWRMDNRYEREKPSFDKDAPGQNLKKLPSQYVKENIYVTTSGVFWHPVLQFVNSVLGADRILFATDYAQESHVEAAQFIESAPISDSDKEKICHLNAERLFKL
jgi:5-carboxyvanillate decarboxylase